ncbi:MAG: hypothetical protein K0R54_4579 [Clostridiaceae bacterium]|jgi:hypothetical protein|nr:hypothetical protein [Clostridiaceae bacterium]
MINRNLQGVIIVDLKFQTSVIFAISQYGIFQDYKKLIALKDIYLKGIDL